MVICPECLKEFISRNVRKKFCSVKCRERHWQKNNREKCREHNRKRLAKQRKEHPKHCVVCENILPKHKAKACSEKCYKKLRRRSERKFRVKIHEEFNKWKTDNGCSKCGYDKCPASIDLHHLYGKDFRITARDFFYKTERVKQELAKCILLCKNCHYELHFNEGK